MLKKFFSESRLQIVLSFVILAPAVFISYALVAEASLENVVFPVAELGNCGGEAECRKYCDNSGNITACLTFAEKYDLMSKEELTEAKKFAKIGSGPGGCTDKTVCESYCEDANHIDECVTFAEANGLMSADKLAEAKKVQTVLKQGAKLPGGCTNKQSCDNYCGDPNHMEECVTFAEAAGFIPAEELEDAKKMLQALKSGVKPPPCRGKEECDTYCAEPGNFERCINFAEAAGFVSKEDADRARKTGGKGPGDCKSKEECNAFCENPANQEPCFNFAKEHRLMSEEDLRRVDEGRQKMTEVLTQSPPAVVDCLKSTVGDEVLDKVRSGAVMPSQELGEAMRSCFEKNMGETGPPPASPDGQGQIPGKLGEPSRLPPSEGPYPSNGFRPPSGGTQGIEGNFPGGAPSPEEVRRFEEQFREQMGPQFQTQPGGNFSPSPGPEPQFSPGSEPPSPSSEPPAPSGGNIFDVIRRLFSQ